MMRFGSIEKTVVAAGMERTEIEKIHDFQTVCRLVRYTCSVNARTRKDALAECLKLFDQLESPETTEINFHCQPGQNSGIYRVEAAWTVKELK